MRDRVRVVAATRCATSDGDGDGDGSRGATAAECDKNLGVTSQIIFRERQDQAEQGKQGQVLRDSDRSRKQGWRQGESREQGQGAGSRDWDRSSHRGRQGGAAGKELRSRDRAEIMEQAQGQGQPDSMSCLRSASLKVRYIHDVNMINLYGIVLLLLLLGLFSPSPSKTTTKCANESVERSWSEMRQLF